MDPSLLLTSLKYWSCPARPDWKEREEELRKKAEDLAARLRTSKERVSQLSQETDSCKSHEFELARVVREHEAKTRAQEEALTRSRAEVLKISLDVKTSKLATAAVEEQLRKEITEAQMLLRNQENNSKQASKDAAYRLSTLQTTLDAGAVEAASLKQKTADLEASLAREQTKIAIATEEVSSLRSNLQDAKVSLEQETSKRLLLEKNVVDAKAAFDTIKAETDSRISQLEGTTTAATVEMDTLRTSLAAANSETVRERNAVKELELIVKSLEMKATEATKGVQEITDRVMDFIYEKSQPALELGKGSFDDNTSVATAPLSPRDSKTLEDAIDSARTETDNLISMFTRSEQDAESRIQALNTTLGTSSTDSETAKASERAARESLIAAQSELDAARKELDAAMLKNKEALEECRGQTLKANRSVSELQAQLDAATHPNNVMYVEELQSKIADLNTKVSGLESSQVEFQYHFAEALRAEMSAIDAEELKNTRDSVNKQHEDAIQIIESKRIILTTELRNALHSVGDVVQIAIKNAALSSALRADIERMKAELKTTQDLTSICRADNQLAKDTNQKLQDTIEAHLKTIETDRGNHVAAQESLRREIQKQGLAASTASDYLNQQKINVLQAALQEAQKSDVLKTQVAEKTFAELEEKLRTEFVAAKALRSELTEQGKNAELCTSALESLKVAHADSQERLRAAEAKLNASSDTIVAHERMIESLTSQLEAANNSGNDATMALRGQLEALRTTYSALEEREKLHVSTEEMLRKQIAELEQSAEFVKKAFESEFKEARGASAHSADEVLSLRAEMEAMQKEHADALVVLNQKLADETKVQEEKLSSAIEIEIQDKQKRFERLKQFEAKELRRWEIYGKQMEEAINDPASSQETRKMFSKQLADFRTKNDSLVNEVDEMSRKVYDEMDVRPRPQRLKDIEAQLVRLELFEEAVTKQDDKVLATLREAIRLVNEEDAATASLKGKVKNLTTGLNRALRVQAQAGYGKDFNSTASTVAPTPSPRDGDVFFPPTGGDESLPNGGASSPRDTSFTPEPSRSTTRLNIKEAQKAAAGPVAKSYGKVTVTRGGLR